MKTPICDFIKEYKMQEAVRMHMPGHKGALASSDITEIEGADSLYAPSGIIAESEKNASLLFGKETLYSAEGASQCIRAMVYLAALHAKRMGKTPRILAGRNAHRAFLTAIALTDAEVDFFGGKSESHLSCPITAGEADAALSGGGYTALYLTSPDYLGNCVPFSEISAVCRKHGVLLLVDFAHGAYLHFLPGMRHFDITEADLACASAHKTLPVLTGGAYLHIGKQLPKETAKEAKRAMALFGSTSPSYLILEALDRANATLADSAYSAALAKTAKRAEKVKKALLEKGFMLAGDEPLKITVCPKIYGYTGDEVADYLAKNNIVTEFHDPDFLVCMVTTETKEADFSALESALLQLERRAEITEKPPRIGENETVLSIREAMFMPSEEISASESEGRILAAESVGCPPAVPIVMCGQRISKEAVEAFRYYGIQRCRVVTGM